MLRNLVDSLPSVAIAPTTCTLCGLMCDLELPMASRCERRNRWMNAVPARSREVVGANLSDRFSEIKLNAATLIWLDAGDVQTTRAAIQLAQHLGATIHVGQSTGSHAAKKVMASDGWLGTTLSEISARADLVVTLGDGVRSEAPLLADRFFQSQSRSAQPYWIHISQQSVDGASLTRTDDEKSGVAPHEVIHWPREQWFERLSQLTLNVMEPSTWVPDSTEPSVAQLSARLLSAKQSVWLWDMDELHFQSDELIIRRMQSIAQALSEQMRCALLPLDLNIGRVTAEETLLWLTGCPTTATWNGSNWYRSPRFADYSLEQWSSAFSSIVLVSNLASDRSLPSLPANITIQTGPANQEHERQVAAVGRDCSGHLFRGDRGTVLFVEAASTSELPTAAKLLTQLMENAVVN